MNYASMINHKSEIINHKSIGLYLCGLPAFTFPDEFMVG